MSATASKVSVLKLNVGDQRRPISERFGVFLLKPLSERSTFRRSPRTGKSTLSDRRDGAEALNASTIPQTRRRPTL